MRFPISLACMGLILSAALGMVSTMQPTATQADKQANDSTTVAYRGSGRISW